MAFRKKNTAESETARAEEGVKTGQKSPHVRNTAAATHKSAARTTVQAASSEVAAASVEKTAFDAALHHEEISKEAYCNWLHNGCPQGSEHNDWIAAIETVRARYEK